MKKEYNFTKVIKNPYIKEKPNKECTNILGISLIVEALLIKPKYIDVVYLSSKANKNSELDKLISLCNKNNIKIIEDDQKINKLSLKENCYGIGIINKYEMNLNTNKHLVLNNINDEGDLGTIIRSAVSFDIFDIVLINSNIDIFSSKLIRASMGSFFHVNIVKYDSIEKYLKDYKYNNYYFSNDGKTELMNIKFKEPYSLIFDNNYELEDHFKDKYFVKGMDKIHITSVTSIVLNECFHQNLKR